MNFYLSLSFSVQGQRCVKYGFLIVGQIYHMISVMFLCHCPLEEEMPVEVALLSTGNKIRTK